MKEDLLAAPHCRIKEDYSHGNMTSVYDTCYPVGGGTPRGGEGGTPEGNVDFFTRL